MPKGSITDKLVKISEQFAKGELKSGGSPTAQAAADSRKRSKDTVEINNQEIPLVKQIPRRSIRNNDSTSDGNVVPQTIHNSEVHSQRELYTSNGINLEILEQLRNLGEELRNDRFKKEQKQYIKHIVNKELSKSRIRSKYVPELIPEVPQESPPREEESESTDLSIQEPVEPVFRSRIRR
ncbi:hypothetical protein M9Y10_030439 [Tritrichomonas musculus]|uniref:Uncharacterized protein n=1 Tax=Tritrichomonas musculus TaxID=1915356 RepID=A0ABR2H377_9EUKA